jgi:competence protein ComEA
MLERYRNVVFAVVIIAIVGGVVALLTYRPEPVVIKIVPPGPTVTPQPSVTPGPVKVYVTGAVASNAAVYSLPPGSRVEDAIKAAGGAKPEADLTRVNLAEILKDGEQVTVPVFNSEPTTVKVKTEKTATPSGPVHINTADVSELERLPDVGPSLAQEIIDYRTKNGPFGSMADLDKVSGIGPSKLAKWEGLIVFD